MNSENPYDAPTEASDASESDTQSVSYLALISVAWGSAPAFAFAIYAFSQNRRALESLIENNEPINATAAAFFNVAPFFLFLIHSRGYCHRRIWLPDRLSVSPKRSDPLAQLRLR